ncbi:capsular biosynthesis protein, partial [Vibrio vulnificus]|nr:capsular biosynthesis protein [Vibrio vulnificus]
YMYDLPLYRHLYSEEERAQFKNKWLKTPGTSQK